MSNALLVVMVLLIGGALVALRISQWHLREAQFWLDASVDVTADPNRDSYYRPLLAWTKVHPPGVLTCLRGWRPPPDRRAIVERRLYAAR